MGKIATCKEFAYGQVYTFSGTTGNYANNQLVLSENFVMKGRSRYDIEVNLKFDGMIYLGFGSEIRTQGSKDACFMPAGTSDYQTPYAFYNSFGSITSNSYGSHPAQDKYGFKIGDVTYKIGGLYTNSWFQMSGLTTYSNYQADSTQIGIVYLPFISDAGIWTTFGTFNATLHSHVSNNNYVEFTIPLEMNQSPVATTLNNAVWSSAYVYYNGVKNHSGYNNPHFMFKYDPFTNYCYTDMKYLKTGTDCVIEKKESTYDSLTDTETIKLTVRIINPVFRMAIEEWV